MLIIVIVNKFFKYLFDILIAFLTVTTICLPITFIVSLFGHCVVPAISNGISCDTTKYAFLVNAVGLGGAGAVLRALNPIIKFLNKPLNI